MPIIAIVNRKGGSGKSTLATHIAAYWAKIGKSVMLGDIDRQQSTRTWLGLRPPSAAKIVSWAVDNKSILRVPAGVTHVVLDTPGGLHGFELAKVVMFADVIIMPVAQSIFDLSSATQCYAELKSLPRVASGKCKIGVVGMRIDQGARVQAALKQWAESRDLPYLGSIRKSQNYVNATEGGLTIFDLPKEQASDDLEQWSTLLSWIDPKYSAEQVAAHTPVMPESVGHNPHHVPAYVNPTRLQPNVIRTTPVPTESILHSTGTETQSPLKMLQSAVTLPRFLRRN